MTAGLVTTAARAPGSAADASRIRRLGPPSGSVERMTMTRPEPSIVSKRLTAASTLAVDRGPSGPVGVLTQTKLNRVSAGGSNSVVKAREPSDRPATIASVQPRSNTGGTPLARPAVPQASRSANGTAWPGDI